MAAVGFVQSRMLLAVWYDLSDVKASPEALDDRASFRRYCGFSGDEATPERTTFVRFRKAPHRSAPGWDKALFDEIATQLKAKAIRVKTGQRLSTPPSLPPRAKRDGEKRAGSNTKAGRQLYGFKAACWRRRRHGSGRGNRNYARKREQ